MGTCRIERSGFEAWPGAALRCALCFFVHLVRDNFISFITSHVAHGTKRVIERLYTAGLKNKAMF